MPVRSNYTILCVDDSPPILKILRETLKDHYRLVFAKDGLEALKLLEERSGSEKIDLILMDVNMPEMNGYEVCERVRQQPFYRYTPILFITAQDNPEDEQKALSVGGNDFITKNKGINPDVLKMRIKTHLDLESYQSFLREQNAKLELDLEAKLLDIIKLQESITSTMSTLAEFRDEDTGHHIKRTQLYIELLAKKAAELYPDMELDNEMISLITRSAPLHDIGKITTPDSILLKPGKLTDEEFATMKLHAEKGAKILETAAQSMGAHGGYLTIAQELAISHHEKWDGSGYPKGLEGENIPISGRLMAVVDVYDALRSERVYKPEFSHEKSMGIILEGAGSHFDPRLVEALKMIEEDVNHLSEKWKD